MYCSGRNPRPPPVDQPWPDHVEIPRQLERERLIGNPMEYDHQVDVGVAIGTVGADASVRPHLHDFGQCLQRTNDLGSESRTSSNVVERIA